MKGRPSFSAENHPVCREACVTRRDRVQCFAEITRPAAVCKTIQPLSCYRAASFSTPCRI
jgi:hypothetical protein